MFKLEIKTDNAAFSNEEGGVKTEVIRILKETIRKMNDRHWEGVCMDINGNKVGKWELTE